MALLCGMVSLLIHPQLSLEHLVTPGAGVLAVLQSLIRLPKGLEDKTVDVQDDIRKINTALHPEEGDVPAREAAGHKQLALPPTSSAMGARNGQAAKRASARAKS